MYQQTAVLKGITFTRHRGEMCMLAIEYAHQLFDGVRLTCLSAYVMQDRVTCQISRVDTQMHTNII